MTKQTEVPEMRQTITVHLVCRDAARAADWYVRALRAEERNRVPVPDGRFMQIELRFGDSTVMIADEFPEMGVVSPLAVGGVYSTLSLHSGDVHRSGSLPLRRAPRFSSRCRTCSGATATGRSSIPSGTNGRSRNTSATSPRRKSAQQQQRCSGVSRREPSYQSARSRLPVTRAPWLVAQDRGGETEGR
jgi:hypothetical protein